VSRWAATADHDAFAQMAMLLLVSLRGNIFLYQGEELGLTQAEIAFEHLRDPEAIANWPLTLGRDGARTPMPWRAAAFNAGFSTATPWLPLGADHAERAVDLQAGDATSLLEVTKRLLVLRRSYPALHHGSINVIGATDALLVFERAEGNQRLMCVFNMGAAPLDYVPEGAWQVVAAVGGVTGWTLPGLSGLIAEAQA
jgi:alpha-glucosidase